MRHETEMPRRRKKVIHEAAAADNEGYCTGRGSLHRRRTFWEGVSLHCPVRLDLARGKAWCQYWLTYYLVQSTELSSCCNKYPPHMLKRQSELDNHFSFYSLDFWFKKIDAAINWRLKRVAILPLLNCTHQPYSCYASTSCSNFWGDCLSVLSNDENSCI